MRSKLCTTFIALVACIASVVGITALSAVPASANPTSWPTSTNEGPVTAGHTFTLIGTLGAPNGTTAITVTTCGTTYTDKIIVGDVHVNVGNGHHDVFHNCVHFDNSYIYGVVYIGDSSSGNGPVLMTHVLVQATVDSTHPAQDVACISNSNFFLYNVDIAGGCRSGAQADGWVGIGDSYLNANTEKCPNPEPDPSDTQHYGKCAHMDAFITNGNTGSGAGTITLDHSTFLCNPTQGDVDPNGGDGCAADIGLFGDNSAVQATVTNNLLLPPNTPACVHTGWEVKAPASQHEPSVGLIWKYNTFGTSVSQTKCGAGYPVADWDPSAGVGTDTNVWCSNIYDGVNNSGNVLTSSDTAGC